MKYRIMFDYGSYEGYHLEDTEFNSVDDAIKHAVAMNYATKFIIVSILWTPKLIDTTVEEDNNNK